MTAHSFKNIKIVFATKHGKGAAAQESFNRVLSAQIQPLEIESDALGTFSGEIERQGSMLDALRGKIQLARLLTNERFVIVSEGSFSSPFGAGIAGIIQGIEVLMLHDALTGAEIVEEYISFDTNYARTSVTSLDQLHSFLEQISFGTHGLVLSPAGMPLQHNVKKGITTLREAESTFAQQRLDSPTQSVIAISDMRAHLNPTRMRAIQACCQLLAARLATCCPACGCGGFGLTAAIPGLPCEECASPTQRARAEQHTCPFCGYKMELPRADGKKVASAAECDWCNP
jgi:hypothetical protein